MAGLMTMPNLGAYTASKFAIVGLSEVLHAEMAPHGVGVSVLCPGLVRTRLGETTRRAGIQPVAPPRSASADGMDSDRVGSMVVDAIRAGRLHVVTHGEYRALVERRMQRVVSAFDGVPPSTEPPRS